MELDIRTLTIAVVIANLLQTIAIYFYYRINRNFKGMSWWLIGSSSIATGFIIILLRDIHSISNLAIVANNAFLIFGLVAFYIGVMKFLEKEYDLRPILIIYVAFVAATIGLTYLNDNIEARTVVQGAVATLLSFMTVRALLASKTRSMTASINILASVFMVQAIIIGFRTAYITVYPVDDVFEPTFQQTSFFLYLMVQGFLYTFGFIIVINQRLTVDLQESTEHFELVFNTSPDLAVLARLDDGVVLNVNDRFTEITGMTREETLGKSLSSHWRSMEDRSKVLDMVRRTGICENFETEFIKKDGSTLTGIVSARRISIHEVPAIISVIHDISGRKRAEESLRESERRYRLLVDSAAEAIVVVQDGRMKLVNPITVRMTGFAEEVLRSRPFIDFVHPDDRALVTEHHRRRMRGEAVPERYVFRILSKDETTRWVEINAVLIDWEGRPATLNFLTDVTERKEAEEAFIEASKKLNLLSSVTRHDISNQLMVLTGNLTLLEMRLKDNAAEEYFKKVKVSTERISNIIHFAKEYEDIGVQAPKWQDVRALTRSVSGIVPMDKVKLTVDVPEGVEVYADPLIAKVFYNLLQNAVKHGGEISLIRIFMDEVDGVHRIVCEDDGVGISPASRDTLFMRGFGKEHGVGLFLSREILAITGIEIDEMGTQGKGARFVITVPANAIRGIRPLDH